MDVPRRSDALPEHKDFRDTGCESHPRCLDCPFSSCRFDVLGGVAAMQRRERDARIRERIQAGADIDTVAAEFGLSRRNIYRITKESRQ